MIARLVTGPPRFEKEEETNPPKKETKTPDQSKKQADLHSSRLGKHSNLKKTGAGRDLAAIIKETVEEGKKQATLRKTKKR